MQKLTQLSFSVCHNFAGQMPKRPITVARKQRCSRGFRMRVRVVHPLGNYSVPGGEWKGQVIPSISEWIMHNAKIPITEYEPIAAAFNPTEFDPAEWVGLAKAAGMKYITITSKHHDGFAMWDSKVSDWDIVDRTPTKRPF